MKIQQGKTLTKFCIACNCEREHELHELVLAPEKGYEKYHIAECRSCGLKSSNPIPSDEELRAWYANQPHTVRASESFIRGRWRISRNKQFIRAIQRFKPMGTLVDVGAGNGIFLRMAREFGNWDLIGTDYSEVNVEHLREQDFDARVGSLDDIGIEGQSIDVLWASHLVEHLAQPQAFFRQVQRYLRPGGIFVSLVPSETSLRARLGKSHWHYVNPPGHLWGYQPETYSKVLTNAGFDVVSIQDHHLVCELMCIARFGN